MMSAIELESSEEEVDNLYQFVEIDENDESEENDENDNNTESYESEIIIERGNKITMMKDPGGIDISFPENTDTEFLEKHHFPTTYYKLSPKERLILLFAENFRRQYQIVYPKRRPLVLAPKNECGVQKFVATTIRPTAFLHSELIGSLEGCAKFVADFIKYEPLEDPVELPPRLISPDTLLKLRKGNSFEMATLLCSMLIGAGFAAMVVSGYAERETTLNDERRVECPFIPVGNILDEDDEIITSEEKPKYVLKERPNLRSKFNLDQEEHFKLQEHENLIKNLEEEKAIQDAQEKLPDDPFINRRIHAWVAVIENAPWCYKPREKKLSTDSEAVEIPTAFFIEPSTGFRHETFSTNYVYIESVWNQYNYYVNRQSITENGLGDMNWDFGNTDDWEHFLPGEPYELRAKNLSDDDIEINQIDESVTKTLDMQPSWVEKLHIGATDYEERYPNCEKSIHYKKAIYERYSPYFQQNGIIRKLTLFEDINYETMLTRWEWYENRVDCLIMIKTDFENNDIEETFEKGRPEGLKFYVHSDDPEKPKFFHFYHKSRLDSMTLLEFYENEIRTHFLNHKNLFYYVEFRIKTKGFGLYAKRTLIEITEKYYRNNEIPNYKDIAIRTFHLNQNKISITFHYAKDAISTSTREFIKPPKPDYGEEIIFDPAASNSYISNPSDPILTPVELYFMLLAQLKREEALKKVFDKRSDEIEAILNKRVTELNEPRLKFSIFDPLRNEEARKARLAECDAEKERKKMSSMQDADFLAPYLVFYETHPLNYQESMKVYNACLSDVKNRYLRSLNELQRRYEDLNSEDKAFKRFISKFQDQFDEFDYERLIKEGKEIALNKRMVQQRLILTHEEAQRKYEKIKESLEKDSRLNLEK